MFEKAVIPRALIGNGRIDVGLLAETLFFYGTTHLLFNGGALSELLRTLPTDDFAALLNHERIKISYVGTGFCVLSSGPLAAMSFSSVDLKARGGKGIADPAEQIELSVTRAIGASSSSKKLAKTILDRSASFKFGSKTIKATDLVSKARQDLDDPEFLAKAAKTVVSALVPSAKLPEPFRFSVEPISSGGFIIDTNLDFVSLNKIYHQTVPKTHSALSCEYILTHLIEARVESFFSANYVAELVTTPVSGELIRLKHFDFLRGRSNSENEIDNFSEIVLPGFPSIRETVNSGARSLRDLLKLIDQAEKFKEFLQGVNPDRGLIAEYVAKATEKNWVDRLPPKSVRFAIASTLGIVAESFTPSGIGTVAGLGVAALDNFYLDRLLHGWRPNQFVEGPYKEFVARDR